MWASPKLASQMNLEGFTNIVVLTGAGISVASGLATFRGEGGLWESYDPEECATMRAWENDPQRVWQLIDIMRRQGRDAQPNAAHIAIARYQRQLRRGQSLLILTQNVDGLHQAAGSPDVLELHGRLGRTRCSNARCRSLPFEDWACRGESTPPICETCGAFLRPDVVLYGEPIRHYKPAMEAARRCDLLLAIGTSGTVLPAAAFVRLAVRTGARSILVTKTPEEDQAAEYDEVVVGDAERIVPDLLRPAQSPRMSEDSCTGW